MISVHRADQQLLWPETKADMLSINIYHASKQLNSKQIKHEYEEMLNVRFQTLLFTILHKWHIPAGSQTTIQDKLNLTAIHKNQMGMEYFLPHRKYNTVKPDSWGTRFSFNMK